MITVGSGIIELLAMLVPFAVLGLAVGLIVVLAVVSKRHGKIFKSAVALVGALGVVGALASNVALGDKNTFETFDNPVAAQASVDASADLLGVATKSAEINEGSLNNAIMDTADLDKITEMRQGDGFYRTLAQGEEVEFTAERNSTEEDGKVSYEVVEGTVSYNEDSIRVEITDGAGNIKVFESRV